MRRFDQDIVNLFILKKLHLTRDHKTGDIEKIVRDISGLHATLSTSPYLSLLARTPVFLKEDLDRLLYQERVFGKARFARKTVYIIPKDWMAAAFQALKALLRTRMVKYLEFLGLTERDYRKLCRTILRLFKDEGLTTLEIKKRLDQAQNISAIVNMMCDEGLLIRGGIKSWRSNLHVFYPFHTLFPDVELKDVSEEKAKEFIIERYVHSYGPVTVNDVAWWTGFPRSDVKKILERFKGRLVEMDMTGLKQRYLMSSSDVNGLVGTRLTNTPTVNVLPALDPYLMGYKDRERNLDMRFFPYVYDRSGNATNSILLDGRIIGVWDVIRAPELKAKLFLFHDIDDEVNNAVKGKLRSVARFILEEEVEVQTCQDMAPLSEKTAGSFMSPLKGDVPQGDRHD
jgi:hypothetical protein